MKRTFLKLISALLAVCLMLTSAPLIGFVGLELAPRAKAYAVGDHIEFGTYPQSQVKDEALISHLESMSKKWISYNYFSGSGNETNGEMEASDYMKFADFFYGSNKYRAVSINKYRPTNTGKAQTVANSYQDENGFFSEQIYYFLYEPITWRVLDPSDGLVVSEMILDSQAFQNMCYDLWQDDKNSINANNYATSSIRDWLNKDFYDLAFTQEQKNNIRSDVIINNNAYSSAYSEFNSEETKDRIFLPSYDEIHNDSFWGGSTVSLRKAEGSDYSKCQGLYVVKAPNNTAGNSKYWIRSPGHFYYYACFVQDYGGTASGGMVNDTYIGIRVSCRLSNLKSDAETNVGDHIQYGTYPQSRVTDTALIAKLNAAPKTWKSYNYYSGTGVWNDGQMTPSDYMRFADFFFGNAKYRAVTFSEYRPYCTGYTRNASYSHQNENGYTPNNVFYFLYEPILWRVLDPTDGLILSEMILDSQAYQNTIYYANDRYWQNTSCNTYASDYAASSIRSWLNYDFYKTAFTDAQKANIRSDLALNNDAQWGGAEYNSASTKDKLFLLSYAEATNSAYGFASGSTSDTARQAQGTDYAKAQGLYVYTGSASYTGCSRWWLRSPSDSNLACEVYIGGYANDGDPVSYTYEGVRAACRLSNLKSDISQSQTLISEIDDNQNTLFEPGKYISDIWLNLRTDTDEEVQNTTKAISDVLNDILKWDSLSTVITEDLKANGFSVTADVFEGIEVIFDPVSGIDKAVFRDLEIYETLILDLVKKVALEEGKAYTKQFNDIVDLAGEYTGNISKYKTVIDRIYSILNTADKYAVLSKQNKESINAFIQSEEFKNIGITDFNKLYDGFGDILDAGETIADFFEYFCNYIYAINISEEMVEFLKEIQCHIYDNNAFRDALSIVISAFQNSSIAAIICSAKLGKDFTITIIDSLFEEAVKFCPYYVQLQMAYKAAKAFDDLMFNTSSSIEAYHICAATEEFVKASRIAIRNLTSRYKKTREESDAAAYVYAMQTYKQVILIDLESSVNFVKKSSQEGLLNKAKTLGHNIANSVLGTDTATTYDVFVENINSIKQNVAYLFDVFMNSWKFGNCYLQKEYPEVYPYYLDEELKKEVYNPKIISSYINEEGDTIVYVVFSSEYKDQEDLIRVLYGTKQINGVIVSENAGETTRTQSKTITDASKLSKFVFLSATNFLDFPKYYEAKGYANTTNGKVYTPQTTVKIEAPCQPVMLSVSKNQYGICLRINDESSLNYKDIEYHIQRKTDDSEYKEIALIKRTDYKNWNRSNCTYYYDTTAEPNVAYTYRVVSSISFNNGYTIVNNSANEIRLVHEKYSYERTLTLFYQNDVQKTKKTPVTRAMQANSDITSKGCISLSWEEYSSASGYQIYRLASYGCEYVKIADVGKNTTVYKDFDVLNGASYSYMVIPYYKVKGAIEFRSSAFAENKIVLANIPEEENCEHVYAAAEIEEPASCVLDGMRIYSCKKCGAKKVEKIPAFGEHTFTTDTIIDAATCSSSGLLGSVCSVCGKTKNEIIPVRMHEDKNNDSKCDYCGESTASKIALLSTDSSDGSRLYVNLSFLNCIGLTSLDATISYDPSVLRIVNYEKGVSALQNDNLRTNRFECGVNTKVAGTIKFGSYFNGSLCDSKKYTEYAKNDKTVDVDSNHFDAFRFCFEIIDHSSGSTSLSLTVLSIKGKNADGDEITVLINNDVQGSIPGDVDNDGNVTAADARLALRRAVELETYPEGSAEYLACDVDHDGKVTAGDARVILRAAVGLESLN